MMKRICIGEIATVHGVKGLVKVRSFVEDESLLNGDVFTDEKSMNTLNITLKNVTDKGYLAAVDGYNDRTAAEKLRGTMLYINRDRLPETQEGTYYYNDLIGLDVIESQGHSIGKVSSVQNFGAGDLLEILPATGTSFYLPFTKENIRNVTTEAITVKIPEGLLD